MSKKSTYWPVYILSRVPLVCCYLICAKSSSVVDGHSALQAGDLRLTPCLVKGCRLHFQRASGFLGINTMSKQNHLATKRTLVKSTRKVFNRCSKSRETGSQILGHSYQSLFRLSYTNISLIIVSENSFTLWDYRSMHCIVKFGLRKRTVSSKAHIFPPIGI